MKYLLLLLNVCFFIACGNEQTSTTKTFYACDPKLEESADCDIPEKDVDENDPFNQIGPFPKTPLESCDPKLDCCDTNSFCNDSDKHFQDAESMNFQLVEAIDQHQKSHTLLAMIKGCELTIDGISLSHQENAIKFELSTSSGSVVAERESFLDLQFPVCEGEGTIELSTFYR